MSSEYSMPSGYTPSDYDKQQAQALGITDAQYYALKQYQQNTSGQYNTQQTTYAGGSGGGGMTSGGSNEAYNIGSLTDALKAFTSGTTQPTSAATSSPYAYTGSSQDIRKIGANLLGENLSVPDQPGVADKTSGTR